MLQKFLRTSSLCRLWRTYCTWSIKLRRFLSSSILITFSCRATLRWAFNSFQNQKIHEICRTVWFSLYTLRMHEPYILCEGINGLLELFGKLKIVDHPPRTSLQHYHTSVIKTSPISQDATHKMKSDYQLVFIKFVPLLQPLTVAFQFQLQENIHGQDWSTLGALWIKQNNPFHLNTVHAVSA